MIHPYYIRERGREMIKKGSIVILSLLVSCLSVLFYSPSAEAKVFRFKFGSTSVRSGFYANTVAMAGIINKAYPGEIMVTVVETGGFVDNVERLRRGTMHAGPVSTGVAAASYLGIMDWKDKPDKNLRALWGGFFSPVHLVASKKSGIATVEDFEGKMMAISPGTVAGWHIENFFKALGIKPNYKLIGLGASPDAMKTGVVDGWPKGGFKDAAVLDIEASMEITIVPIRQEHIEKAEKYQPGLHRSTTIPAGVFKAVKTDQLSYAFVISDFVVKAVPEDVVYKIVRAVWENRSALIAPLPALMEGKFDNMVGNAVNFGLKVPFHAGAVKFYREVGQKIPPELIPPEMK